MRAAEVAPDAPLLLTIAQVALQLAVSERTVESLISRRQLGSVRIGRARRVPITSVIAFIEDSMREQADFEQLPADALRLVRRAGRRDQ